MFIQRLSILIVFGLVNYIYVLNGCVFKEFRLTATKLKSYQVQVWNKIPLGLLKKHHCLNNPLTHQTKHQLFNRIASDSGISTGMVQKCPTTFYHKVLQWPLSFAIFMLLKGTRRDWPGCGSGTVPNQTVWMSAISDAELLLRPHSTLTDLTKSLCGPLHRFDSQVLQFMISHSDGVITVYQGSSIYDTVAYLHEFSIIIIRGGPWTPDTF